MEWTGGLLTRLAAIEGRVRAGAATGVNRWAEHVLGESTKVVPIEEGTLSRSGRVTMGADGDVVVGAVSYDTPYAVRQHEEMGYRHDKGRQAKYLEGPLKQSVSTGAKLVQEAVREALA